jgi:hypothetical protein
MGFKSRIERHPLTVMTGAIITTASVTAGVVMYQAKVNYDSDAKILEATYKQQVEALQTKLGSIERRIGEKETYFDISKLMVHQDKVPTVGSNFRTIGGDKFFIAEPDLADWTYSTTSWSDTLASRWLIVLTGEVSQDKNEPKSAYLWRGKQALFVRKRIEDADAISEFSAISPYVAVRIVSKTDLVEQSIPVVSDMLAGASGEEPPSTPTSEASGVHGNHDDVRAQINALLRGDPTALMLSGVSSFMVSLPLLDDDLKVELRSAQKKENVFYLQSRAKLDGVEIQGNPDAHSLIVDEEIIGVMGKESLFLVMTHLPSADGRSSAVGWIGDWLGGLRVPIDTL